MAQPDKGSRDLIGARVATPVYEVMKGNLPHRGMGPYLADVAALLHERPDLVTDNHSLGAIATTRPIYDAALAEAARLQMPLTELLNLLVAHGLHRPELLDIHPAEQEALPFADDKVA
ncbi:hypothetical protein AB0L82_35315 [Nocardia sp. NPDC052001]|uniref:hypothetical protein n=1 Tax=Nocardia sp. NPDC052001 TaxID=3154853 RepID=UPI003414F280